MGFSFCFGPSGSGKSRVMRKMIIDRAAGSLSTPGKDKTHYIVIVPEQYTMQTQKDLVEEHPSHVLMNIDVLSFGRLAYRVFQETGEEGRTVLDDIGKSLLLRRVVSECGEELTVLQKGLHSAGMIDEIKSILSEFLQYGVGEKEIDRMASFAGKHGQLALQARLLDMGKLFSGFKKAQEDRYVTTEETLDVLARLIPVSDQLRGSVVLFDGFTGFTPVQYRVVRALIRTASDVFFSFTVSSDGGPDITRTAEGGPAGNEEDLFYLSRKTVRDIVRMGEEEGFKKNPDIYLQGRIPARFHSNPVLAHLEASLFRYPEKAFSDIRRSGEGALQKSCLAVSEKGTGSALRLFAASTPQEEVRRIFSSIREMIAATGCAYRDFAIVTADLETYGDLFEREAVRSRIPVYIDRTSPAFNNILTEGIRSVLQISSENFSYPSVFRYLRSGISRIRDEEVDRLENYCLANGIRGRKKWGTPFDASCEETRLRFLREISPVTGEAGLEGRRPVRTAADRTMELYRFLVNCGAQEHMESIAARFEKEGDSVRSIQYRQIYRAVIDLLDKIHDLTGRERISARDYLELVETGLSQISLGTIPQRVDRILVGDIERTRLTQVRHLFFAGVNDGNIPRSVSKGGILSDMDREFLASLGAVLSPAPRQQMFIQRLYLYLNMTKPSETLTVSFARVSQDQKSMRPSYLVHMLRNLFPDLKIEIPEQRPVEEQIRDKEAGRSILADLLRRFVEGSIGESEESARDFRLAYGFYTSPEVTADPEMKAYVRMLKKAALCRYRPEFLPPETAHAVYGDRITGGISRMETGAKCLLYHHLKYGLHLHERELYEFAPVDTGTVLHDSLQRFHSLLAAEGLSWNDFTTETAERLVSQALDEEAAVYRNLLMYKSARDESRLARLKRRLLRTVDTVQFQISKGDLVPVAAELQFGGEHARIPALTYDLQNGLKLILQGRIDRVDMFNGDGRRFLRVMDYKSGKRNLDQDQIRRGLQLQLIMYMEALMHSPFPMEAPGQAPASTVPSALLYYSMKEPVLDLSPDSIPDPENQKMQIRQQLKPTGLVYEDEESISHLDRSFADSSMVIPVIRKKNGGYRSSTSLITPEQYTLLASDAVKALCSTAQRILDGEITAAPAVIDARSTACDYCPYRDACGFDLRIPGYMRTTGTGKQ